MCFIVLFMFLTPSAQAPDEAYGLTNYLRNFSWSYLPLVIGKPSVIEGHFQMRFSKFSILTLFGYLQDDNIVNSYLNILFAIYHHLLFR